MTVALPVVLAALLVWAIAHICVSKPADEFQLRSMPRALTITVSRHAVERAQERHAPEITAGMVIAEVADALHHGRRGKNHHRYSFRDLHEARGDAEYAWTADSRRAYVIRVYSREVVVITTLPTTDGALVEETALARALKKAMTV